MWGSTKVLYSGSHTELGPSQPALEQFRVSASSLREYLFLK